MAPIGPEGRTGSGSRSPEQHDIAICMPSSSTAEGMITPYAGERSSARRPEVTPLGDAHRARSSLTATSAVEASGSRRRHRGGKATCLEQAANDPDHVFNTSIPLADHELIFAHAPAKKRGISFNVLLASLIDERTRPTPPLIHLRAGQGYRKRRDPRHAAQRRFAAGPNRDSCLMSITSSPRTEATTKTP